MGIRQTAESWPFCHPEARDEPKDLGGRTVPPPRFLSSARGGSAGTIRILTAKTDRDGQPRGRTIAFTACHHSGLFRAQVAQPSGPGNAGRTTDDREQSEREVFRHA